MNKIIFARKTVVAIFLLFSFNLKGNSNKNHSTYTFPTEYSNYSHLKNFHKTGSIVVKYFRNLQKGSGDSFRHFNANYELNISPIGAIVSINDLKFLGLDHIQFTKDAIQQLKKYKINNKSNLEKSVISFDNLLVTEIGILHFLDTLEASSWDNPTAAKVLRKTLNTEMQMQLTGRFWYDHSNLKPIFYYLFCRSLNHDPNCYAQAIDSLSAQLHISRGKESYLGHTIVEIALFGAEKSDTFQMTIGDFFGSILRRKQSLAYSALTFSEYLLANNYTQNKYSYEQSLLLTSKIEYRLGNLETAREHMYTYLKSSGKFWDKPLNGIYLWLIRYSTYSLTILTLIIALLSSIPKDSTRENFSFSLAHIQLKLTRRQPLTRIPFFLLKVVWKIIINGILAFTVYFQNRKQPKTLNLLIALQVFLFALFLNSNVSDFNQWLDMLSSDITDKTLY